jgi:hypothetical protein
MNVLRWIGIFAATAILPLGLSADPITYHITEQDAPFFTNSKVVTDLPTISIEQFLHTTWIITLPQGWSATGFDQTPEPDEPGFFDIVGGAAPGENVLIVSPEAISGNPAPIQSLTVKDASGTTHDVEFTELAFGVSDPSSVGHLIVLALPLLVLFRHLLFQQPR